MRGLAISLLVWLLLLAAALVSMGCTDRSQDNPDQHNEPVYVVDVRGNCFRLARSGKIQWLVRIRDTECRRQAARGPRP